MIRFLKNNFRFSRKFLNFKIELQRDNWHQRIECSNKEMHRLNYNKLFNFHFKTYLKHTITLFAKDVWVAQFGEFLETAFGDSFCKILLALPLLIPPHPLNRAVEHNKNKLRFCKHSENSPWSCGGFHFSDVFCKQSLIVIEVNYFWVKMIKKTWKKNYSNYLLMFQIYLKPKVGSGIRVGLNFRIPKKDLNFNFSVS